jgi:hypothetical protein
MLVKLGMGKIPEQLILDMSESGICFAALQETVWKTDAEVNLENPFK